MLALKLSKQIQFIMTDYSKTELEHMPTLKEYNNLNKIN